MGHLVTVHKIKYTSNKNSINLGMISQLSRVQSDMSEIYIFDPLSVLILVVFPKTPNSVN